jgi:hypothetical protein
MQQRDADVATEGTTAEEVTRRPSWNFAKIPVFPPDRPNRPERASPMTLPPIMGAIQRKLAIGRTDDPLEHEADRVADQVMNMPTVGSVATAGEGSLRRKCAQCEEEDKLHRKTTPNASTQINAPSIVQSVLNSPGQPLDPMTRAFMEPRLGYDFCRVRVHTDAKAAESAHAVNALAYSVGRDVVFGAGRYKPDTNEGKRLLAHELVHTIQQDKGAVQSLGMREIGDADARLEREAGRAPQPLDTREPPRLFSCGAFQVAREPDDAAPEESGPESSPAAAEARDFSPAIAAEETLAAPKLDPCKVNAVFSFAPAGGEKANCLVPQGQHGASSLARFILTGVPAGTTVTLSERFKALEDPYGAINILKPNTYTTSDLKFDDCYLIASKDPLPTDFILKVEQNHLLEGEPISKNIITFTPTHVLMRFCSRVKGTCNFSDVCRLK